MAAFKCIVLGDAGVGKSAYISRYLPGYLLSREDEQSHATITPVELETNYGQVTFEVYDFKRDEGPIEPEIVFYSRSNCALLVFDVSRKETYVNAHKWYRKLVQTCGNIPCILAGNKADIVPRTVMPKHVRWNRSKGLPYMDLGALSNYNFIKPFEYFTCKLLNTPTIHIEELLLSPADPMYVVPPDRSQTYEEEVRATNSKLLIPQTVPCAVCECEVRVTAVTIASFCLACQAFYKKHLNDDTVCARQGECNVRGVNRRRCTSCRLHRHREALLPPAVRNEAVPIPDGHHNNFDQQLEDLKRGQTLLQQELRAVQAGLEQVLQRLNNR